MNTFIWHKRDLNTCIMLQNISTVFQINDILLNYSSNNSEKISGVAQEYEAAQPFSTLIRINVSWAANYIRMIPEGSCDTEVMMLKIQLWSQE